MTAPLPASESLSVPAKASYLVFLASLFDEDGTSHPRKTNHVARGDAGTQSPKRISVPLFSASLRELVLVAAEGRDGFSAFSSVAAHAILRFSGLPGVGPGGIMRGDGFALVVAWTWERTRG
jgi:hypothetical protein